MAKILAKKSIATTNQETAKIVPIFDFNWDIDILDDRLAAQHIPITIAESSIITILWFFKNIVKLIV